MSAKNHNQRSRAQISTEYRNKRLKYAVGTSLLSKIITAIVQIIAFPIAVRALGNEQFVLYAMLASAVGWLSLLRIGIGPVLTVRMADAAARKDRVAEKRLFASALLPMLFIAFLLGTLFFLAVQYVPIDNLFGPNYFENADIIKEGVSILVVLFLLRIVLSVIEAAQLGYQEQYILNLATMTSNIFSVIGVLIVAKYTPSVIGLILAVNIPLFLGRCANAMIFFVNRSFLMPSIKNFSRTDCKYLLSDGIIFSMASGLGNFLCHQFPVILAGRAWGVQDAASFTVSMNALIIASGMVSMMTISFWPAISDSITRGEFAWVRLSYHRLLLYCAGYGTFVGIIFAVFGTQLFRLWYGSTIQTSQSLNIFLGLYFALLMWENANFTMLIGMKIIVLPSILYLIRSICSVSLMMVLFESIGTPAPYIALCISLSVFTLIPFTFMSIHTLRVKTISFKIEQ